MTLSCAMCIEPVLEGEPVVLDHGQIMHLECWQKAQCEAELIHESDANEPVN